MEKQLRPPLQTHGLSSSLLTYKKPSHTQNSYIFSPHFSCFTNKAPPLPIMRLSCNGCRILRKGCSDSCTIRPCLQWIKTPESQANATFFLAKFYGRAGLINLINAGPEHLRPGLYSIFLISPFPFIQFRFYLATHKFHSGWSKYSFKNILFNFFAKNILKKWRFKIKVNMKTRV